MAIIYKHRNQPIPRLPAARRTGSRIIDSLLAKRPAERYGTAGEAAACAVRAGCRSSARPP